MNQKAFAPIIIILIVVAVLAMGGGGVYYKIQKDNAEKQKAEQPQSQQKTESTLEVSGSKDKIADWKTYKNDEYGFEMKYPNNWDFANSGESIFFASQSIISRFKQSPSSVKAIPELTVKIDVYPWDMYEKGILVYMKSTSNRNIEVLPLEIAGLKGNYRIITYLKNLSPYKQGDKMYSADVLYAAHITPLDTKNISFVQDSYFSADLSDAQYLDIFNKMISSIKFLK